VWAGQQALEKKLVDRMGGIRHALDAARDAAHLPADAPIEERPVVQQTLLEYALELAGLKANAGIQIDSLPVSVREILRGVAPMMVYADGQALARMEWVPVEDSIGNDDAAQDF
jgi:protease-4